MIELSTVAVVDFRWNGHHPTYFRHFCETLLSQARRVAAFCPQPQVVEDWCGAAHHDGRLIARELTDEVLSKRWIRKAPGWANRYRFRQVAQRLAEWEAESGHRINFVFFACLFGGAMAGSAARLERSFPYRWSALLLDSACVRLGYWQNLLGHRSLDPLAAFRARGCKSLATLDPFIASELGRRLGGKPVHVLPEPVDASPPRADDPLCARIMERAAGRSIIGCFGQFARRKGVLEFIAAARHCIDEPWLFVWVGPFERDSFSVREQQLIDSYMASAPANCLIELRRVADGGDFNALVCLADVLFLLYHRHLGSSNMISKAALFGKPVLVRAPGCMADHVRQHCLGESIEAGGPAECRVKLRRLLDARGHQPAWHFADYRRAYSAQRFAETLNALIPRDAAADAG